MQHPAHTCYENMLHRYMDGVGFCTDGCLCAGESLELGIHRLQATEEASV